MKPVTKPQAMPALVDKQGLLTVEAHLMLLSIYDALIEAQQVAASLGDRVTAAEAAITIIDAEVADNVLEIADHEARIAALEP